MNCFVEIAVSKYPKILLFLRLCVFFPSSYRCNGEVEVGSKALDDVLYRAQLELFPEALLVGATFLFIFFLPAKHHIFSSFLFLDQRKKRHVIEVHMLTFGPESCTAQCAALCGSVRIGNC